jgi:hypothetical protein
MLRRPESSEYAPYYGRYIDLVPEEDICAALTTEGESTQELLASIGEERSTVRYAPDKWSIRQLVGHVIDSERIFGYRALCIARGEKQPLPGFDQEQYAQGAAFDGLPLRRLAEELALVRRAGVLMLRGLPEPAWHRDGVASDVRVTVRALAYIILGHERHHLRVLRERYLS